jgi:hypothetical protein
MSQKRRKRRRTSWMMTSRLHLENKGGRFCLRPCFVNGKLVCPSVLDKPEPRLNLVLLALAVADVFTGCSQLSLLWILQSKQC